MTDQPSSQHFNFAGDADRMAAALQKCAANIGRLVASETARVKGESKKTGKEFEMTYSYAGLPSVLEAIRPGLVAGQIALIQLPILTAKGAGCTTLLIGEGWQLEHTLVFPAPNVSPQTIGGLQTYARRYALLGIFSLAPDEDDGTAERAEQEHRRQATAKRREQEAQAGRGPTVTPEDIIRGFARFGVTEAALVAECQGTPIAKLDPSQVRHLSGIIKRLREGAVLFDVLSDDALDAMRPVEPAEEPAETSPAEEPPPKAAPAAQPTPSKGKLFEDIADDTPF